MLDELIAKIKALLGRSDESDEEEEGTGVFSEQTGMLDTKTNMQKPPSDEDEEEDPKAALRSKIIRLVVVGVIVYVALDEFVFVDPPPQPQQRKSVRKAPKKKKNAVAQKNPTAVPTPAATPGANPVTTAEATPEAISEATPEATPEDMAEITPEPTPEAMSENTPEPTPEAVAETTPDTTVDGNETKPDSIANDEDPLADMISEAEVKPTPEVVGDDKGMDPSKAIDGLAKDIDEKAEGDLSENTKGLSALGEALSKMKENPKTKTSITNAPDYLIVGRGLVYNCRGKHWACVDKKSYFKCAANQKESKTVGKKPDCGTVAVYQTEEDCQVIQLYNINTSRPTDFCSL